MFSAVLVANRGEIAVRICRTLRTLGVRSVVVASLPDRASLAVRTADEHVVLDGYAAGETYLDIDVVIAAAKATGCEAIHPGYGFLSERADFAERCAAAGIVFIGPSPAALRQLGDKSAARQLAVANGVPVVPGYDGRDDDATLIAEAGRLGFPVMVKARGGGGGRGMREVHDPAELPAALESARREALASFGDGGLLLERLIEHAHHVEVQVLADSHGAVIHLGERDCSVQRRRQKLIEETPSPVVDAALRERLTGAAVALARAAGLANAATVEFLVGEPGPGGVRPYYLLEVNPRLQVEHPVTEMVTGLDIVELQLRIAAGEPLPLRQDDVRFAGHAIELRVNAEDPWNAFRPSTGLVDLSWLEASRLAPEEASACVFRADIGFEAGDTVPAEYDSLVAKLISHAPDRAKALELAARHQPDDLWGPRTNLGLHHAVLGSADFRSGAAHIAWLDANLDALEVAARTPDEHWAAAAVALGLHGARWFGAGPTLTWLDEGQRVREIALEWSSGTAGSARVAGGEPLEFQVLAPGTENLSVRIGDSAYRPWVEDLGGGVSHVIGAGPGEFRVVPPPPLPRRAAAAEAGATVITAPLPGKVAAVRVAEGETVEAGALLLILEAMKMEHRITATAAGTVRRVAVQERDQVREGDLLVEIG